MTLEIALTWVALAAYGLGSTLGLAGLLGRRDRAPTAAAWAAAVGLAAQTVLLVHRWVRVGHGPYISAFEVLSSSTALAVLGLLIAWRRWPSTRGALGPALAVCAGLLVWAVTSSPAAHLLPPTFGGPWMFLHITFGKLAFVCALVASGVATVYLVRQRHAAPEDKAARKRLKHLDRLTHGFIVLGFVALTFMIVAGALWARGAWGRYWSWDPLETWSLATWVVYGLFLHARLAFRVRGRASAIAVLVLLALTIVTFFIAALVLPTVHTETMVS